MIETIFKAIDSHNPNELKLRLKNGADPNANEMDWPGFTPLQVAIEELDEGGPLEAIDILIKNGGKVNKWDASHDSTPLLMAVFRESVKATTKLLKYGADANVVGGEGDTPQRYSVSARNLDLIEILLSNGANNTIDIYGGFCGLTALGMAAKGLNFPMVEVLLKHGADPKAIDEDDYTAVSRLPDRDATNSETWDRIYILLS